jgi:hypothetical protein
MKLPTDYEILKAIYEKHYKEFVKSAKTHDKKQTNLSIDIKAVADKFCIDVDIIFGRLYYYLDEKYSYERPNGSKVAFFSLKTGDNLNTVNFPLLSSVLAGMIEQRRKDLWNLFFGFSALIISCISLASSFGLITLTTNHS